MAKGSLLPQGRDGSLPPLWRYSNHSQGPLHGCWRRASNRHGGNLGGLWNQDTSLDLANSSFWLSEAGEFHPTEVPLISIPPDAPLHGGISLHFLTLVFCYAYTHHMLSCWGGNKVPALRQLILWGVSAWSCGQR